MRYELFALAATIPILGTLWYTFREERQSRILSKEEERKDAMKAILAHSLRTPLTSTKWYVEMMLKEKYGKLRLSQIEVLHDVQTTMEQAIEMLNKMIEISHVDRVVVAAEPTTIDLQKSVQTVLDTMMKDVESKKLSVKFQKKKKRPLIFMDTITLHSILEAVLGNAVAYSDTNGSLTISVEEQRKKVHISIKDTGIGIPEKEQKRIFEEFYRGSNANEYAPAGTGLGLYFVKELIEHSKGTISCSSKEGKGSTFILTFPSA